jgi:hypothetical protein
MPKMLRILKKLGSPIIPFTRRASVMEDYLSFDGLTKMMMMVMVVVVIL